MGVLQDLSRTKILFHILVCFFGISSWVDINSLFIEMPVMVPSLPEGWALPSFAIIITQIGNIGPISFTVFTLFFPKIKPETAASFIIIIVGALGCLLLSFFWQTTTVVGGELHSTALLIVTFMLAFVDTTSSVAFMAFMACVKPEYLATFFVGEGLSGMIPGLIALGQGAGNIVCSNTNQTTNSSFINGSWYNETSEVVSTVYTDPRFSVQGFFLITFAVMCMSAISFLIIIFHPYCKSELVTKLSASTEQKKQKADDSELKRLSDPGIDGDEVHQENIEDDSMLNKVSLETQGKDKENAPPSGDVIFSRRKFLFLVSLTTIINMQITSFLLSVQSYSCLPYSILTYHLVVTLTNIADPTAGMLCLFFPTKSLTVISVLTSLGSVCSAYIIVLAAMSPRPLLVDHTAGGALSIIAWVLVSLSMNYSKVSVAGVMREGGRRAMMWCGAFTQIGAFIGAVIGYILVNVYHVFKDAPYC